MRKRILTAIAALHEWQVLYAKRYVQVVTIGRFLSFGERLLWVTSSLSTSYQANGWFRPMADIQLLITGVSPEELGQQTLHRTMVAVISVGTTGSGGGSPRPVID
jgi:hypothetical protein